MHVVDCDFLQFTQACLAAALVAFGIPGAVFWPYFAGTALLAIGLPIIIKNELPQAHGLEKILPFGHLFFTIPMVVFAAQHFTSAKLLVGSALIAAALSIVVKRHAQLAATLLGIMFILFEVLLHIPRVVANPRDRFAWAVALRDLSFSGGAFAFAGAQMKARPTDGVPGLVTLGRFFVAIPAVFFGVEHFLHPEFAPGVPLNKLTPTWIPMRLFWAYFAGAVLVAAGASLIVKGQARLAATCLGVMILLLVLFIYLPIVAADPSDIGNGLNYLVDTLAFSGAALVLADALPREDHPHV